MFNRSSPVWGGAEQWHLFAERATVPVAYTDPDARIQFANLTFERQFGFLPRSATGQYLWEVIVPADTTGDPLGRVRNGDALTFLATAKSKRGQAWKVWVSCISQREADGRLVGCVVALTDVHDRHGVVRGTDDERLRAVLAATSDGVVLFDDQGIIGSANAVAERMFGYPVGDLVGRSVHLLIPTTSGAPNPWAVGSGRDAEAVRRDGSRFDVVVTVGAAGGAFAGVVSDPTRVRELEQRVVDAADAVRQEVGEDLHDNVGQQLTGLELMVDALAKRVTGSDPATGAVAARIAERLRQVHSDVRQLATGIVPTEVPADGLVAALDRFVTRIRDHYGCGCELVTTNQVRLVDAATATHLLRIVQEAVSNAIRHSHTSAIRVTVRPGQDAIVLEVQDDGGGFSMNPDGGGLGTRLMHDRATRIGGTLTIAASDGGTVVTVRLPAVAGDSV